MRRTKIVSLVAAALAASLTIAVAPPAAASPAPATVSAAPAVASPVPAAASSAPLLATAVIPATIAPNYVPRIPASSPVARQLPAWRAAVSTAVAAYQAAGSDLGIDGSYSFDGPYLNYATRAVAVGASSAPHDAAGIPQTVINGRRYYNPVSVAQFALAQDAVLDADPDSAAARTAFDAAIARLLTLESPDGAFRYAFAWHYYLLPTAYQPGWVSAMAQGQAISAFVRAYQRNPDPKYLDAARRAYALLQVPVADGGVRSDMGDLSTSLKSYVFYEEYVSTPDAYTLNGYMFTMLGINDWCRLTAAQDLPDAAGCAKDFAAALRTLDRILPFYDIGGFSAYDLGHLTFDRSLPHLSAGYHRVHIQLLTALNSVTGDATLAAYAARFLADVS